MLEDFRHHLGRRGDGNARQFLFQNLLHAPLIGAVGEGVHEAHRHRQHAALAQHAGHFARPGFVQRGDDIARRVHALVHRQAVTARDIGAGNVLVGVPQVFLVGAADLDHVAEAFRAHHRGARQAAGDQRVGGHRGAVRQQGDFGEIDVAFFQAGHEPVDRVRCRCGLGNPDQPGRLIEDTDVGESSADIDGHAKCGHGSAGFLLGSGGRIVIRTSHPPGRPSGQRRVAAVRSYSRGCRSQGEASRFPLGKARRVVLWADSLPPGLRAAVTLLWLALGGFHLLLHQRHGQRFLLTRRQIGIFHQHVLRGAIQLQQTLAFGAQALADIA